MRGSGHVEEQWHRDGAEQSLSSLSHIAITSKSIYSICAYQLHVSTRIEANMRECWP